MTSPYDTARADLARVLLKASEIISVRHGMKALAVQERYKSALAAISTSTASQDDLRGRIVALVALYAVWAYEDGFGASGANAESMTVINQSLVAVWVAEQIGYAAGLAEAMYQNSQIQATANGTPLNSIVPDAPVEETIEDVVKEASATALDTRLAQWSDTLGALQAKGRTDGSKQGGVDIIVTFHLGPSLEHCKSENGMIGCEDLDNQRHPFSWFEERGYLPRVNGNPNITCHGWFCLCFLSDDLGNVIY